MFTKTKPVITTLPENRSNSDEDIKYKHLHTKLFNDGLVQPYQKKRNKYKDFHRKEYVEEFRKEAKGRFSHFV